MGKLIYAMALIVLLFGCGTENTPTYTLSVNVEPSEAGSVSPSSEEFDDGAEISITATPNQHWVFSGWQGGISGSANPASLIMNSDVTATALFGIRDYPLTVNITGQGNVIEEIVQAKTTDYPHGTTVQLTAVPDEGWNFVEWQGDLS